MAQRDDLQQQFRRTLKLFAISAVVLWLGLLWLAGTRHAGPQPALTLEAPRREWPATLPEFRLPGPPPPRVLPPRPSAAPPFPRGLTVASLARHRGDLQVRLAYKPPGLPVFTPGAPPPPWRGR
jgi:hypothetical protein